MQRLNECGQKVSSKNFCGQSTSTYIWEAVLVKLHFNFYDWHLMKPPFRLQLAFAGDGIGIVEVGDKGIYTRCTRYVQFIPPQNADYTWPDTERDNQWSRSELTIGPQGVIRSVMNTSSDWISLLDETDRGILCLYDKLWFYSYLYFTYDQKADPPPTLKYDISMEVILQPVKINRIDYLEHLIDRTRCGNECYDQNVYEYPCISKDCVLPKDFEDETEYDIYDFRTDKTVKVKGKKLKQNLKDGTPGCIDVCVVSGGGSDCSVCERNLEECRESNLNLKNQVTALQTQVTDLQKKLDEANKTIDAKNEEIKNLNLQIVNLTTENNKLTESNKYLTEENNRLETENDKLETENSRLKIDVKNLNTKLTACQADSRKKDKTISDLESEVAHLEQYNKELKEQVTYWQNKFNESDAKVTYYQKLTIRTIMSKWLRCAITLMRNRMDSYPSSSESKLWEGLWTSSFDRFHFENADQVEDLGKLFTEWDNSQYILRQEIKFFSIFVYLFNFIHDGPIYNQKYPYLDIFEPSIIKDNNIIYEKALLQKLSPISLQNGYELDYILNWTPSLFQTNQPKEKENSESQEPQEGDLPQHQSQKPPESNQEKQEEDVNGGNVTTGQTFHGGDSQESMDATSGTNVSYYTS